MAGSNPVYYWDTCIFIAWLKDEQPPARSAEERDGMRDCVARFKRREISIVTSVLTITEISAAKLPVGTDTMLEEVMQLPNLTRPAVDIRVARLARDIRNYYLLKSGLSAKTLTVPDAIHVATAIIYKATEFHTFDKNDNTKQNSLGLLPLSGDVGGHNLTICIPPNVSNQMDLLGHENS